MKLIVYIRSYWQTTTGDFNNKTGKYENVEKSPVTEKWIEVQFSNEKKDRPIIKFIGGPTGYESYYFNDLLKSMLAPEKVMYICGGTINSYPSCYVRNKDLLTILNIFKREIETL